MDTFIFTSSSPHKHSSTSVTWGAEMFNLKSENTLRVSICEFERGSNYFNLNSFDAENQSAEEILSLCNEKRMELKEDWFDELKDEVYAFLSYEPDYTYENQFNPPPSKPSEWHPIVNKILLISLFSGDAWKARVIKSTLSYLSSAGIKNIHIFFSYFLNEDKYFVSILSDKAYEETAALDKLEITVQDIFYNSLITYSSEF